MERGTPQFSPRRSGRATPMDQRGTRRGARSCGSTNTRKAARSDDLREVGGGVSVPIVCMGRPSPRFRGRSDARHDAVTRRDMCTQL